MIFAGSAGAVPLGGGTHRSGCLDWLNAMAAVSRTIAGAFIFGLPFIVS
jgi:hypothetical protein